MCEINYLQKEFLTTNFCIINYGASLILGWQITVQESLTEYVKPFIFPDKNYFRK